MASTLSMKHPTAEYYATDLSEKMMAIAQYRLECFNNKVNYFNEKIPENLQPFEKDFFCEK